VSPKNGSGAGGWLDDGLTAEDTTGWTAGLTGKMADWITGSTGFTEGWTLGVAGVVGWKWLEL